MSYLHTDRFFTTKTINLNISTYLFISDEINSGKYFSQYYNKSQAFDYHYAKIEHQCNASIFAV